MCPHTFTKQHRRRRGNLVVPLIIADLLPDHRSLPWATSHGSSKSSKGKPKCPIQKHPQSAVNKPSSLIRSSATTRNANRRPKDAPRQIPFANPQAKAPGHCGFEECASKAAHIKLRSAGPILILRSTPLPHPQQTLSSLHGCL